MLSAYVNTHRSLTDNTKFAQDTEAGDGRIVLGRAYSEVDDFYTSMEVDELSFFNEQLYPEEIDDLFRDGARFLV